MITTVQQSQYSTPVFMIPKKEETVIFMIDYRRINRQLVRKPYPSPRIGETMHKLEGFQYATALNLNMGYYTIRLFPDIQYMTTTVTEFGKFRYNCLPMGMCASGDIFLTQVDKLLGDIEGVKTYIDNILVLSKDCFGNHIEHLRIIFGRLRAEGLKVNAPKCIFGLKEIPNLGYVIIMEGIKSDPNKLQMIMDPG